MSEFELRKRTTSGLLSPLNNLSISDELQLNNFWFDLINLHKDVIKSVQVRKRKAINNKIKLFFNKYGKTFNEDYVKELNPEDERLEKSKRILNEIKKSLKPVTHQRIRIIPDFNNVIHLNDLKDVSILW
jgi:hypothetical protein